MIADQLGGGMSRAMEVVWDEHEEEKRGLVIVLHQMDALLRLSATT